MKKRCVLSFSRSFVYLLALVLFNLVVQSTPAVADMLLVNPDPPHGGQIGHGTVSVTLQADNLRPNLDYGTNRMFNGDSPDGWSGGRLCMSPKGGEP